MRSGDIDINIGNLWGSGFYGYNWLSLSGSSEAYAYYLSFGDGGVYPSPNVSRMLGFPLRCLAN